MSWNFDMIGPTIVQCNRASQTRHYCAMTGAG
jgi:hypothetical protein